MISLQFESAIEILKIINSHNFEAYIVGGAVRDYLLGLDPHDTDITTNMPIDQVSKIFKNYNLGDSKQFGIIGIKYNDFTFEIANFRTEFGTDDGRHPKEIKIAESFEEDSKRRDFTINAMGMDKDLNIIDYHGGREDLKNKIIKFVGNPNIRIQEDYLRMLRAVRFASKFNFAIDGESWNAIYFFSNRIMNISVERIWQEIYKMASNTNFNLAVSLLDLLGLLEQILLEVQILISFTHDIEKHPEAEGNVLGHVFEIIKIANTDNPLINLSCLFHDIGKSKTYEDVDGVSHYNGHDKAGVDIFNVIANRLKIDNYTRDVINFCIENHMRFHLFNEMKISKIIKLVKHEYFDILFEVAKADEFARGNLNKDRWDIVLKKIEEAKNHKYYEVVKRTDIISGDYIMKVLDIKPSKVVGVIKEQINNMLLDNEIKIEEVDKALWEIKRKQQKDMTNLCRSLYKENE